VSFVDYIDDDELERFGLHNDGDDDGTLIDAKWESLALAPVGDEDSPDDYFLFTAVRPSPLAPFSTFLMQVAHVAIYRRITISYPHRESLWVCPSMLE